MKDWQILDWHSIADTEKATKVRRRQKRADMRRHALDWRRFKKEKNPKKATAALFQARSASLLSKLI